ncbi:MAG: hypothetical protein QXV75_08465 [Candidatus Bathyarchaeia archaeon]
MKQLVLTCRTCSKKIDLFSVPKGFAISIDSITVTFHCPNCDKRYKIKDCDEKWLKALGDRAKEFFGFDLIKLRNMWKNITVKNLKL